MVLTILWLLYFLNKCVWECFPRMVRARNINIRETKCPMADRLRFSSFLETIKNIFHNHLRELIFTQFILYPSQIGESIILYSIIPLCLCSPVTFLSRHDFERIGIDTKASTARGIFAKISTTDLYQYMKVNCRRIDCPVIFRYRFNVPRCFITTILCGVSIARAEKIMFIGFQWI